MTKTLNFQSIMLNLQHFWSDHGCLIWQPYYAQVGAGTLNPSTALRVLGPEPWNVAYVEPSIRPDDGRYGENPNRMQMHYQFQVILKPDPGNPQEVYLNSLETLGIDLKQHDIRFVEDNWESPALGAWGLGWEVWLDGQEITQFTYFQQAGGRLCDPVSVEITYGLDRIAIALQRVHGFTEIKWNQDFTAGDLNLSAEQEHSKYYFEAADVDRVRAMFDLYEQEAETCLAQNLVLPAHDYLLKCSHNFNVLDARGSIGVTERQAYFGRMRDVARRIADAYIEQRQRLEFPFLQETTVSRQESSTRELPSISEAAPFILEIGTEEMPASDLDQLLAQIKQKFPTFLAETRLDHGVIHVYGTPRRLVAVVEDLAPRQPDLEQTVKGPPAARAFDDQGQPNKAAQGFARSRGIPVEALEIQELDGGSYVTAVVREDGISALEVLADALPEFIGSLRVDKPMRWDTNNVFFSRPIRWLLAMHGEEIVPFEFAGVHSGKKTHGLRSSRPKTTEIHSIKAYFSHIENQGIILDPEKRKESISTQINQLAKDVNGSIEADPDLLSEVTNLIEAPLAVLGKFDESHLSLPREILITVMKKHQRYFPVFNNGKMLPYFITVCNRNPDTSGDLDLIVEGNEHVIRARFADAHFFIHEDRKQALSDYIPSLGSLTFQTELGSMLDKVERISRIVTEIGPKIGLNADQMVTALKAASLSKADLTTHMVVEMTSLQGFVGGFYALQDGESQEVATAIYEHYLPRHAGDRSPDSKPAMAIGVADRLDSLVGLFAVDLAPSGTKDPFAQRRAALGLIQVLIAHDIDFDLQNITEAQIIPHMPIEVAREKQTDCLVFIRERLRNVLREEGHHYDVVDAVLTIRGFNPALANRAVVELGKWTKRSDWNTILPAYARCVRITRQYEETFEVDPAAFVEPMERELHQAIEAALKSAPRFDSVNNFFDSFLPMIPTINQFFEQVLVMAEDAAQRNNRLGLLQRIAAMADHLADFSRLEGF